MSRKLLAGAVAAAGVLALTPGIASADCTGHIYNCPGYQYQCVKLFLGNAPSVFTNSAATEDSYEDSVYVTATGVRVHWYRCYGD